MDRALNIAVIGTGFMGQNHVKVLSSLENVNLIAICDKDNQKTKKIAKQYKLKAYVNFETLIKNEKLDAISVCLPTTLHFEVAAFCIKKKIPVFIEKPISANVKEAKALRKLAILYKTPVMVGHIERFNPVVNEIRLRIKSGELGKIIKIHTQRFSPPVASQQDVSVIVDLATHDIDVMNYLIGEKIVRIYSETDRKYNKTENIMSALMRFKSGIIGLLEVSWVHPTKIRNLTIIGENGLYQANYLSQELFFYKQNKQLFKNNFDYLSIQTKADVVKIAFESREPLYLELKAFTESILNKSKIPVTIDDGLFALDIAEKISISGTANKILKN